MAARVSSIGDLSSAAWAGKKPKNYKGTDLDKALKAWETLAAKPLTFPPELIPPVPEAKVGAIEGCIVMVKGAITEVEKFKGTVSKHIAALKAVAAAGAKASGDLLKQSQDKKKDKDEAQEYRTASIEAGSLGSSAAFFCQRDFE